MRRRGGAAEPRTGKDGLLHIPDVPGIGLEWNEDAVTANRADFF
jgi:mandelate racemase